MSKNIIELGFPTNKLRMDFRQNELEMEEEQVWVTIKNKSPESELICKTCEKCTRKTTIHPNYIRAGIDRACFGGRTPHDDINVVATQMCKIRGWNLVELYYVKKGINNKTTAMIKCQKYDTDHICILEYETLRRGGSCGNCGKNKQKGVPKHKHDVLSISDPKLALEIDPDSPYQASNVTYGSHKKVLWICQIDPSHSYESTVSDRIRGHGCRICKDKGHAQRLGGHDYFVDKSRKVHGDKYQYNEGYKGSDTPINIYCPKPSSNGKIHGNFLQRPGSHKNDNGCPQCAHEKKKSEGIKHIESVLQEMDIEYVMEVTYPDLFYKNQLYIDIFIESSNLIIEFDGQTHWRVPEGRGGIKQLKINQKRDMIKDTYCLKNGISLIRIPYTQTLDHIRESLNILIPFCKNNKLYLSYEHYITSIPVNIDRKIWTIHQLKADY